MLVKWSEVGRDIPDNLGPILKDFATLGWIVERVPSCSHGGPKTIGTYLIVHLKTKKAYVGSNSNIYSRPYQHHHLLTKGKHWIKDFQDCFNQDSDLVVFLIATWDRDSAYDIEQKILDKYYGTEWLFNSAQNARCAQLGFEVTDETKNKIGLFWKGRTQSPEHVAKRSNAQKGKKRSLETREKLREKAKARGVNPELTLKAALVTSKAVWVEGIVYPSRAAAAEAHGIGTSSVHKRLASRHFSNWQNTEDIFDRAIAVDGNRYDSIEAYSLLTHLNPAIIKLRIDSDAEIYSDWRYVD